jgi:hypothetical protein
MGRRSVQWFAAAALVMCVLAPSDSSAQGSAYAGTWAPKRAQCRLAQDKPDAPLVLTRDGYDQHETHCKFGSVRAHGKDTWRVRAKCSVQGDAQNHTFTLVVAGASLTIRDERGARILRRCR